MLEVTLIVRSSSQPSRFGSHMLLERKLTQTYNNVYCFVVDKRSVLDKLSLKTGGARAPAREAR